LFSDGSAEMDLDVKKARLSLVAFVRHVCHRRRGESLHLPANDAILTGRKDLWQLEIFERNACPPFCLFSSPRHQLRTSWNLKTASSNMLAETGKPAGFPALRRRIQTNFTVKISNFK
jgi:hypothetical protein